MPLSSHHTLFLMLYFTHWTHSNPLCMPKHLKDSVTKLNNVDLRQALKSCELGDLYRGIPFKLLFNLPYLTSVYLTTQAGNDFASLLSWGVTAALYPLMTLKTQSQLTGNTYSHTNQLYKRSIASMYRGVLPFLAMNVAFSWTLRPLFSD